MSPITGVLLSSLLRFLVLDFIYNFQENTFTMIPIAALETAWMKSWIENHDIFQKFYTSTRLTCPDDRREHWYKAGLQKLAEIRETLQEPVACKSNKLDKKKDGKKEK